MSYPDPPYPPILKTLSSIERSSFSSFPSFESVWSSTVSTNKPPQDIDMAEALPAGSEMMANPPGDYTTPHMSSDEDFTMTEQPFEALQAVKEDSNTETDSFSTDNLLLTDAAPFLPSTLKLVLDAQSYTDLAVVENAAPQQNVEDQLLSHSDSCATVESSCTDLESSLADDMDLDERAPLEVTSPPANEHYLIDTWETTHIAIHNGETSDDLLSEPVRAKVPDNSFYESLPSPSPPRDSSPFHSSSSVGGLDNDMDVEDSNLEDIEGLEPRSSSPIRSSTPDLVFSSSPIRGSSSGARVFQSSPPRGRPEEPKPLKRSLSATDLNETPALKRKKSDPKIATEAIKPTAAARRITQFQKLKTPFRSPVTQMTKDSREYNPKVKTKVRTGSSMPPPSLPAPAAAPSKVFSAKVASQFKSPVAAPGSSSDMKKGVHAAPNIQALQRRLQLLKRAAKIKNDKDEEKLAGLVKKWTEVGREVAWEVWAVAKETIVDSGGPGTNKGGWDDREKKNGGFGDSWGWNESQEKVAKEDNEYEQESEVREATMGTMLRQMRIDPATLGWDEEEGEFVDR